MEHQTPQPRHNRTATPGVKLTRHSKGWVAKIGGKVKWLAPLSNPQLAVERYHQKMKAYLDGLNAQPVVNNNASLGYLGDLFLAAKAAQVERGELGSRTMADYSTSIQRAVDFFGYDTPALSIGTSRWQEYRQVLGAMDQHSQQRFVGAVRSLSKWAVENEHIDRGFRFGTEFKRPSQKAMRTAKVMAGERVFTAGEVSAIVKAASPPLRAMFLIALNGGVGNMDLARLTHSNVNLDSGTLSFERSKTGVARVIPLWPETVRAIREAIAVRPAPRTADLADRLFLTIKGHAYVRDHFDADGTLTSTTDAIGMTFWKLPAKAKGKRSWYDARRTFQTIGDERGPAHVVRAIMGHADRGDDMSGRYRQSIPRAELEAVVTHVRARLNVAKIAWSKPAAPSRRASKVPARSVAKG